MMSVYPYPRLFLSVLAVDTSSTCAIFINQPLEATYILTIFEALRAEGIDSQCGGDILSQ